MRPSPLSRPRKVNLTFKNLDGYKISHIFTNKALPS